MDQPEFATILNASQSGSAAAPLRLLITLDVADGCFRFEWRKADQAQPIARAQLRPGGAFLSTILALELELELDGRTEQDGCGSRGTLARALTNRLRQRFPVSAGALHANVLSDIDLGPAKAGVPWVVPLPEGDAAWKWLARELQHFIRLLEIMAHSTEEKARGHAAARALASQWLQTSFKPPLGSPPPAFAPSQPAGLQLRVTLHMVRGFIQFDWLQSGRPVATGRVNCVGEQELAWELKVDRRHELTVSSDQPRSIHGSLQAWLDRFPVPPGSLSVSRLVPSASGSRISRIDLPVGDLGSPPWPWLEDEILAMAEAFGDVPCPAPVPEQFDPFLASVLERDRVRLLRKEQKQAEAQARQREAMARLAEERRDRERRADEARKESKARKATETLTPSVPSPAVQRPPLPPVPVHIHLPPLEFQETAFPLSSLRNYQLRERAALWWVSNQSDDLLCLPHCRIERLEFQLRTALRVLGPMRGRALLSDEVGLGKTIEAGLVLKELLTRGMVKRFLVLTTPSLVDQWEEELSDKFGLATSTTNHAEARADWQRFWRESPGLIASLHTLKQPAHLELARQVHWDILIVDEAHYLRSRESQAWQAVSALPRQFLLLLTATPVQNSLEELYNLVTLLQPGQLLSPKEFRARFINPKRPRQPREPEELRRLLAQVMVRNTRANAGLQLPPRRAETVLFEPNDAERAFWQQWETEFRERLAQLNASQASLWGRLLLQAAGSSPAAWREALEKFPDRSAARAWREQAPLEPSWRRKCELLQPLTRGEGGAVIFTQFLRTQSALAESLRAAGIETFVINGATPAPERQPITEEFHRRGGALLLTHSGTEGRNLQFSHCLANFDLPWNPMEIEQRIGRLHRLGQQHPVRIFNFVQAGTLQQHLLEILQEKLNLFELVVGETGLVLGERFSSDEFAEEVLRRWRESEGRVGEAIAGLGEELAAARDAYGEVKKLDETLFEKDYET
ncbi:SNF2-related protein [Verrucomicrobia bacterium]|nr:SNF2-related protein [Verrucomicrobiota bacterium]